MDANTAPRRPHFQYLIDVSGACNLRCPSCPVGNFVQGDFSDQKRTKGFMSLDLFRQVLDRIKRDNIGQSTLIVLYNWGEPLIHPEIATIIRMIREYGFNPAVSSNLNTDINLKAVVKENPGYFRVSLSGYQQSVYERTHRNGQINLVLSNMYRLRHYMDTLGVQFFVEVYYHIYHHNCGDDIVHIKMLSDKLGFRFNTQFAYFMPLDKVLKYLAGEALSAEDRQLVDNLLVKPEEQSQIAIPFARFAPDCTLRRDMIPINWDGTVPLCCNVFDYQYNVAPDFLAISHDELQARRYAHPLCGPCMSQGLHIMGENLPPDGARQLRALGNQRLTAAGSKIRFG